jgi:uncharacterized membrane protein
MEIIQMLDGIKVIIIEAAILLCETIGVLILLTTVAKSVIVYFRKDKRVLIMLAQGIGLALEFKLAGEVLRTVTVRGLNELAILGIIIALRGAIALLIHWEIKTGRADMEILKKTQGK